jgi:hypothetical protein
MFDQVSLKMIASLFSVRLMLAKGGINRATNLRFASDADQRINIRFWKGGTTSLYWTE